MRERIDRLLNAWGHLAYRRAWPILLTTAVVVAALSTQLTHLVIETSTEEFLHVTNPKRVAYDAFRAQFGRDDQIVLAVRTSNVFDRAFLERLRALHRDIEDEVPNLEDVTSLINARNTRGEEDRLVVGDLLETMPESEEELDRIEAIARANEMYRNLLLSEDARIAAILVKTSAYSAPEEFDELAGFDDEASPDPAASGASAAAPRPHITAAENTAIVEAIDALVARHAGDDFEIFVAGTPPMMESMQKAIQADMTLFTALAIGVIMIALALLFRRVAGVVLPMISVLCSVVTTLAIMAIAGVAISVPTQILPSFLLAVGVGYSVHVLAIFYQHRRGGADVEDAIAFSLGHSGLAIIMTSLTTAGGLLSFAAAELKPVAEFGTFAPLGVMIGLVYTILLLPALCAVFPMGDAGSSDAGDRRSPSQRALVRVGHWAHAHAVSISLVTAGLCVAAFLGALQIGFDHDPIEWFPEDNPFRIANQLIDDELRGAMFLEVLIDSGRENGIKSPDLLARIESARRFTEALDAGGVSAGKTVSIVDVVKETHQALNENRPEFYAIPSDPELVAQELLLFENSGTDDLEDLVDPAFRLARFTVKTASADAIGAREFISALTASFAEIFGDSAEISLTGIMVIMEETVSAVTISMARTYLVAFAIITPLMILLIGRFRIGVVAMVPNLTPILFTLGFMGYAGIPLDAFTLLVGSIAIGLAVDDTIHFMHHFRRYYEATGDIEAAITATLETTGQALLYTSLVLAAGFFIYMLATMQNLFYFGLLTGVTIVLAFIADVILSPALITLVMRREQARATEPQPLENPT